MVARNKLLRIVLNTKRSAIWRFFLLCLFCFSWPNIALASDQSCSNRSYDESATVKYIYDGDTIQLLDGRKFRLIGINTPEVARKARPAEAYALQARDRLRTLLQKHDNQIKLIYGKEKQDHYQRSLAHIFLPNGDNLQTQLLSEGLANAITIPPNGRYSACYQQAEKKARCQQKGLWSQKITAIAELDDSSQGFHVLQGKLKNIKTSRKGLWLELEHGLSLRIAFQHRPLFNMKHLKSLLGQSIIVRGWLQSKRKPKPDQRFYIQIKHPSSIEGEKIALKC